MVDIDDDFEDIEDLSSSDLLEWIRVSRTSPKSASFAVYDTVRRMFGGFMSLWIRPREWI